MWWNVIYIYTHKIWWFFFLKKKNIMTKYYIFIFCTLTKKKIAQQNHHAQIPQYHSSFTISLFYDTYKPQVLTITWTQNESHVRKWVQWQWCNVQKQYNGWKQEGNDYQMKERKNFKCSYELLSCFKCFMNCFPFFKKKGMEGIVLSCCSFWSFLSKKGHIECVKVLSTFDISYQVLKTITIGHKVVTSPN